MADSVRSSETTPYQLGQIYRAMMLIRLFEKKAVQLQENGLIPGPVHSSIGQEAVAVGISRALRQDDRIVSTHRGHGHALAKGADPSRMMAELLGRVDGYCKGKGGSMHLVAKEVGVIGSNGIVAAGLPIAAGAALANKLDGGDSVVIGYFGDGAVTEGLFHEAMNLSSLWKLPVVWVCETNSTTVDSVLGGGDITALAASHGVPPEVVDGNDVLEVKRVASRAVAAARVGNGPRLIEARTVRRTRHSVWRKPSRPTNPAESGLAADDPIRRLRETLESLPDGRQRIDANELSAVDAIREAVDFALASPHPPVEFAVDDVFGHTAPVGDPRKQP